MFKHTLTACAVLTLLSSATSQQKQQLTIEKAITPQFAGTYHPATGFVSANQNRVGTDLVINNTTLSGYFAYAAGPDQEWIDNNILMDTNGNGTESVNCMEYTYCSSWSNPNGIYETITVYDDSVYCAGPTNWPTFDCGYGLATLPGGVNGALACWVVALDLTGVECNLTDGHGGSAGWGQIWDNNLTGPWLASGGLGQTNSFTWFDWSVPNANAFQGCYWFGGTPWAGFAMKMYGEGAGMTLTTTGAPGGTMSFDTTGASPGGTVATMYAFGIGSHTVSNPITGNSVTTGLASTGFTIADLSAADGSGTSSYSAFVPSAAAGLVSVQSGDGLTDGLSNVVNL